jgi:hypothetical protein
VRFGQIVGREQSRAQLNWRRRLLLKIADRACDRGWRRSDGSKLSKRAIAREVGVGLTTVLKVESSL